MTLSAISESQCRSTLLKIEAVDLDAYPALVEVTSFTPHNPRTHSSLQKVDAVVPDKSRLLSRGSFSIPYFLSACSFLGFSWDAND